MRETFDEGGKPVIWREAESVRWFEIDDGGARGGFEAR